MGVAFNVALYCVFDCHRTPEEEPAKSDFQKTEVEGPGTSRQDGLIGTWYSLSSGNDRLTTSYIAFWNTVSGYKVQIYLWGDLYELNNARIECTIKRICTVYSAGTKMKEEFQFQVFGNEKLRLLKISSQWKDLISSNTVYQREIYGFENKLLSELKGIWQFTEGDMTYSGTNYILEICENRNRLIKSIKHPDETRKLEYEILVKVWHASKSEIFFDLIEVPENNKGGFYPSALKYDRKRRIIKNAIEEALVNFEFERISTCKTESGQRKTEYSQAKK